MKTIYTQRTVEYLSSIQHPIPPNGEIRETEKGVKYYILSYENKI